VRKYWEVYAIKAMIVAPGGMGTLDEMFEVLTLIQCGHCPKIPIVLLGKEFFNTSINFKYLADCDMISQHEVDALCITDDPVEAFTFIRESLTKEAESRKASAPTSPHRLVRSPVPVQKRERDEDHASPAPPAPPAL
jgi:predicted Rossmann-fold nucleotide-binding protein